LIHMLIRQLWTMIPVIEMHRTRRRLRSRGRRHRGGAGKAGRTLIRAGADEIFQHRVHGGDSGVAGISTRLRRLSSRSWIDGKGVGSGIALVVCAVVGSEEVGEEMVCNDTQMKKL
jgi:hypothetical protein